MKSSNKYFKIFFIVIIFLCFHLKGKAQITNDSCFSALDLGYLSGQPDSVSCLTGFGNVSYYLYDSTTNAIANFPYPTIPLLCKGYSTIISSPAKDVWYKFHVNCNLIFQLAYNSDTVNLSFWKGDSCSNLSPIACYTSPAPGANLSETLPNLAGTTIFLQVSGPNNFVNTRYSICLSSNFQSCIPIFLTSPPTPVLCMNYTSSHTNCTSTSINDGSVSINILNGHGPFNCIWSDNYVGFQRFNMLPGRYYYSILDIDSCMQQDSVLIEVATNLYNVNFTQESIKISYNSSTSELVVLNDNSTFERILQFIVYDDCARIIFKGDDIKENRSTIELAVQKGIYFTTVITNYRKINRRFIVY